MRLIGLIVSIALSFPGNIPEGPVIIGVPFCPPERVFKKPAKFCYTMPLKIKGEIRMVWWCSDWTIPRFVYEI